MRQLEKGAARYVFNDYPDRSPSRSQITMYITLEKLERNRPGRTTRNALLQKLQQHGRHRPNKLYPPFRFKNKRRPEPVSGADTSSSSIQLLLFPRTVSDWNHLSVSITSFPPLESFQARLGRSLHNLQPGPACFYLNPT